MRSLLMLLLTATPALAEVCPAPPDLGAEKARLLDELRVAPDELTARLLSAQLWEIWLAAPDAAAQDLLDLGMERRTLFDFPAALAALDALVDYCPDYSEGYNQRAFVNFLAGDYEAALIDLDRAIELTPRHLGALSGRALTLIGLGRDAEAQAQLREALDLNPWLAERALLTGTDL